MLVNTSRGHTKIKSFSSVTTPTISIAQDLGNYVFDERLFFSLVIIAHVYKNP